MRLHERVHRKPAVAAARTVLDSVYPVPFAVVAKDAVIIPITEEGSVPTAKGKALKA